MRFQNAKWLENLAQRLDCAAFIMDFVARSSAVLKQPQSKRCAQAAG